MGDMNDDGYETMVCVEATRYAKDLASGALLMPGEKGALSTEISVTRRHKDPPARPRWGRRGGAAEVGSIPRLRKQVPCF